MKKADKSTPCMLSVLDQATLQISPGSTLSSYGASSRILNLLHLATPPEIIQHLGSLTLLRTGQHLQRLCDTKRELPSLRQST